MSRIDAKSISEFVNQVLGWQYLEHGRGPKGIDCYGLVLLFARHAGYYLPDYKHTFNNIKKERDLLLNYYKYTDEVSSPRKGDIVLLKGILDSNHVSHIGIIIGEQTMLHCAEQVGVVVGKLSDKSFTGRVVGFYRLRELLNDHS